MGMVLLEIARKSPRVFSYFEENCFAFTQGGCYNIIALERGPMWTLQFPDQIRSNPAAWDICGCCDRRGFDTLCVE